jgi:hypothetical protein
MVVSVACLGACALDMTGLAPDDGGGGESGAVGPGDSGQPDVTVVVPDDGGIDAPGSDTSPIDAPLDTFLEAPVDAPADDATGCPGECNGGCSGGTCTILVTTVTSGSVNCPTGFACYVHCAGSQVCMGTINCAAGYACTVSCDGDEACTSNSINQNGATSLCVACLANNGNPGCDSVSCTGTCSLSCTGGCGASCGNCASVPTCP